MHNTPSAAALEELYSGCWTLRVRLRPFAVVHLDPEILAPFVYIAMHVVQAPGVRQKTADFLCSALQSRLLVRYGLAKPVGCPRARPTGKLPFGLRRQRVVAALLLAQLGANGLGVLPAHLLDRQHL